MRMKNILTVVVLGVALLGVYHILVQHKGKL